MQFGHQLRIKPAGIAAIQQPGAVVNSGAVPSGTSLPQYLETHYRQMEATLFGPKVEAEAYRFMQQRLTNAGYSPAEIDKILDVLGYSMPADGLVYAPQPTEVLP